MIAGYSLPNAATPLILLPSLEQFENIPSGAQRQGRRPTQTLRLPQMRYEYTLPRARCLGWTSVLKFSPRLLVAELRTLPRFFHTLDLHRPHDLRGISATRPCIRPRRASRTACGPSRWVRRNRGIKLMGRTANRITLGLPGCPTRGVYVHSRPPRSNLGTSLTGGIVARALSRPVANLHDRYRRSTVGLQLRSGGVNKVTRRCTIPSNGMYVTRDCGCRRYMCYSRD